MRVEEAYINKIEGYKVNETALIKEWEIRVKHKESEIRAMWESEERRLTLQVNLYKEKLSKRENENRVIRVDLKIEREKVE